MENKVDRIKEAMFILLWVDAVILLPCFIASLRWILLIATKIDVLEINLFNKIFELLEMVSVVPLMFFILGHCFFSARNPVRRVCHFADYLFRARKKNQSREPVGQPFCARFWTFFA